MTSERKRTDISLSDKFEVIKLLDLGMSQSKIARTFGISQPVVSNISRNREDICQTIKSGENLDRKRQRTGKAPDVEKALANWVDYARNSNIPFDRSTLIEKSEDFAKLLNVPDFKPTNGWLSRWKERNDIKFKMHQGQKKVVDVGEFEKWLTSIKAFPKLKNDVILRAARGESVPYTPIWIMRQAGRYLPEFLEVKAKHDFFTICRDPELACQVTLQPIARFKLDAAIIFSDILVIPQALGMQVEMLPGVGPKFTDPLTSPADMDRLDWNHIESRLSYVYEAVSLTRHRLEGRVPLIGFCGAPWTLASYMIEGQGSKTHAKAKRWLYAERKASHQLLAKLTDAVVTHLVEQAMAGAQMLQVFESHAGALTPDLFREFALPYLKAIASRVRDQVKERWEGDGGDSNPTMPPLVLFAKDAYFAFDQLVDEAGYDVISLDWTVPLRQACDVTLDRVTLQGNLDPCALYAPEDDLKADVERLLHQVGSHRHIFNLGHGIYPDSDPDKVKFLVDIVHKLTDSSRTGK